MSLKKQNLHLRLHRHQNHNMDNQILKKQLEILPAELRDLIVQGTWSTIVAEIAQKNNFSKDKALSFENETLFVLLGVELLSDYQKNLERELFIPELLAKTITDEMYTRIFNQVKVFLPSELEPENQNPSTQITANPDEKLLPEAEHLLGNLPGSTPVATAMPQKTEEKKWWKEEPMSAEAATPVPQKPASAPQAPLSMAPARESVPNFTPNIPETSPVTKPALDILHTQAGTTPLEQKLTNQTNQNTANKIVQKSYQGQDPYREPIS